MFFKQPLPKVEWRQSSPCCAHTKHICFVTDGASLFIASSLLLPVIKILTIFKNVLPVRVACFFNWRTLNESPFSCWCHCFVRSTRPEPLPARLLTSGVVTFLPGWKLGCRYGLGLVNNTYIWDGVFHVFLVACSCKGNLGQCRRQDSKAGFIILSLTCFEIPRPTHPWLSDF